MRASVRKGLAVAMEKVHWRVAWSLGVRNKARGEQMVLANTGLTEVQGIQRLEQLIELPLIHLCLGLQVPHARLRLSGA